LEKGVIEGAEHVSSDITLITFYINTWFTNPFQFTS